MVLVGACLIGLCIFGIRGRTGYNPIKVSAAYFCQDAFLNQLGVSPTFNLLTSVMDDMRPENKYLHLMDEQEAITKAQALLNRQGEVAAHRWLCTDMLQKQIACSKVAPMLY